MAADRTNEQPSGATVVDEAIRLLRHFTESFGRSGEGPLPALFPDGVTYLSVKLDISGIGAVEIEVGATAKGIPNSLGNETEAFRTRLTPAALALLPCQPGNATAAKIVQTCEDVFDENKDDCNKFVKAVVMPYFGDVFEGLDADGIIAALKDSASGWTFTASISDAITNAEDGCVVIAGMTSKELAQSHGHLAVVVGCPGAMSGNVTVPVGYAGSLDNASARIRGARLSGTFPASSVRNEKVSYFVKALAQQGIAH